MGRYKIENLDLTGKQFGKLTVIGLDHTANHKTYWRCRCECGGECVTVRHNLTSGKTKSCGCLRGNSKNIKRGNFRKVELSRKDEEWILKHYRHTRNIDIKEKFGITDGWLHRFARAHGLKKTKQFMRKAQAAAVMKARESHIRNNSYPPKGYVIPKSEEARFKKGVTPEMLLGKKRNRERIVKGRDSRRRTYELERTRARLGLPQQTKMKVIRHDKSVIARRSYLKHLGYKTEDGWNFIYDDKTKRSDYCERTSGRMTFQPATT